MTIKLLDNVNVNTTGDPFIGKGAGQTLLITADDLGGGSVSLETSLNKTTGWTPVFYDGAPFVVTTVGAYYLRKNAQGLYMRAVLSGATGASNVTVALVD